MSSVCGEKLWDKTESIHGFVRQAGRGPPYKLCDLFLVEQGGCGGGHAFDACSYSGLVIRAEEGRVK